jgi:predicted DNA-binding transcriptional regulator YafY
LGRRSSTETAIAVLAAFFTKRRWEQAELARHVGVQPRTLRSVLGDLERHGVPLERKELSGREIHWLVPKSWLPNGAVLTNAQAGACARLLGRMPKSEARDSLLRVLMGAAAVAVARADREEAGAVLAQLEDGLRQRLALRILYESASSRATRARLVSVHHVAYGAHVRFVASSHESGRLLWFRADRVHRAEPWRTEPYRAVPEPDVRAFVAGSVDGFSHGEPIVCRFFVHGDVAGWVKGNLPVADAKLTEVAGGMEIDVATAGLEVLARFVVGLGDKAQGWTPELAAKVRELAEGALGAGRGETSGGAVVRTGRDSARPPARLAAGRAKR